MKKKENKIVAIRPQKRDKLRLHFRPKALVEMFDEFRSLLRDYNGEDAQSIQWMLEDVLNVLKWGEKHMNVKEEKVKIEKDETI